MYYTPVETRKARKPHRCTNCGEAIPAGSEYKRWMSVETGDRAYSNKMHPECLSSLQDDAIGGEFEYMPFSGERPILVGSNIQGEPGAAKDD